MGIQASVKRLIARHLAARIPLVRNVRIKRPHLRRETVEVIDLQQPDQLFTPVRRLRQLPGDRLHQLLVQTQAHFMVRIFQRVVDPGAPNLPVGDGQVTTLEQQRIEVDALDIEI